MLMPLYAVTSLHPHPEVAFVVPTQWKAWAVKHYEVYGFDEKAMKLHCSRENVFKALMRI